MAYGATYTELMEAVEDAKFKGGPKTNYLSWKDGDTHVVRFISDVIYKIPTFTVKGDKGPKDFREAVDTEALEKPRPCIIRERKDVFGKPSKDGKSTYPAKPSVKGIGIVVLREEDLEEDPNRPGRKRYVQKDKYEEVEVTDADGKTTKEMRIKPYLVIQTGTTFWSKLEAIFDRNGNFTEYDISITRKGSGTDTSYTAVPITSDWKNEPGEAETYYAEQVGDQMPDPVSYIEYKGSEEYYKQNILPLLPDYVAPAEDAAEEASEAPAESASAPAATTTAPKAVKSDEVPSTGDLAQYLRSQAAAK